MPAFATIGPEGLSTGAVERQDLTRTDWVRTDTSAPELAIQAPFDMEVSVVLEAMVQFGPHRFEWTEGPITVGADESVVHRVTIPREAFLHPLAESYVSDLYVRTSVTGPSGERGMDQAGAGAFVLWPDGPESEPVVWSRDDMAFHAPHGTIDAAVLADGSLSAGDRVLPPIGHMVRPSAEDEGLTRTTVPVDDQSDEEGL